MVDVTVLKDIADLAAAPYNPRQIGKDAASGLAASIDRFGDIAGIVFNAKTQRLVCGHQRVEQLRKLGAQLFHEGDKPVLRVGKTGERFAVRVVEWDEAQEKAANIAANNPYIGGDFTDELQELLKEVHCALGNEGFDELQLGALLEPDRTEAQEDEAPEPPAEPVTKPGDLWLLGDHRLVCGDSTVEAIAKLAQGELAPFIMVTDPPYGVEYDPAHRAQWQAGATARQGAVSNDSKSDWSESYSLFSGDVAYVWHASLFGNVVHEGLGSAGIVSRSQIVWRKQHFAIGRSDYHWQHECALYGVRKGSKSRWCGDRTQSTVWDIQNHSPMGGKPDDADTDHGTQKPVECMARPIRNHGAKGDSHLRPVSR